MNNQPNSIATARAQSLRDTQTKSEGLLWSILRAKQLCGLKFRRQYPIGPWIADFACQSQMVVVEIDGGYHDVTSEEDLRREKHIRQLGWDIVRFTDKDVEEDAEAVARAIAQRLRLPYEFQKRNATGAGMNSVNAAKKNSA
ncbi:MAG: endonuclease domain-containing protein [Planctomycetales bacterium]|jgi:very-short-patch-repair endonuclease